MKGTVAPSSSRAMAAATCTGLAASSTARRCSIEGSMVNDLESRGRNHKASNNSGNLLLFGIGKKSLAKPDDFLMAKPRKIKARSWPGDRKLMKSPACHGDAFRR